MEHLLNRSLLWTSSRRLQRSCGGGGGGGGTSGIHHLPPLTEDTDVSEVHVTFSLVFLSIFVAARQVILRAAWNSSLPVPPDLSTCLVLRSGSPSRCLTICTSGGGGVVARRGCVFKAPFKTTIQSRLAVLMLCHHQGILTSDPRLVSHCSVFGYTTCVSPLVHHSNSVRFLPLLRWGS